MYVERVVHISEDTKEEFETVVKSYTDRFEKAEMDYNIIQSRFNGVEGYGFKAEIPYGF